ncbi:MAG: hypothetical protein ABFS46_01245 [Myxococcota bacterium]
MSHPQLRRLFGRRRPSIADRLWRAGDRLLGVAREQLAPSRLQRTMVGAVGVAVVLCALSIVALRTEILRTRYQLADLIEEEARLRDQRAELRVALSRLRAPERLARLARERGFGPPDRVIELSLDGGGG